MTTTVGGATSELLIEESFIVAEQRDLEVSKSLFRNVLSLLKQTFQEWLQDLSGLRLRYAHALRQRTLQHVTSLFRTYAGGLLLVTDLYELISVRYPSQRFVGNRTKRGFRLLHERRDALLSPTKARWRKCLPAA